MKMVRIMTVNKVFTVKSTSDSRIHVKSHIQLGFYTNTVLTQDVAFGLRIAVVDINFFLPGTFLS